MKCLQRIQLKMLSAKVICCIFFPTLFDSLNVSIDEKSVDQDKTAPDGIADRIFQKKK